MHFAPGYIVKKLVIIRLGVHPDPGGRIIHWLIGFSRHSTLSPIHPDSTMKTIFSRFHRGTLLAALAFLVVGFMGCGGGEADQAAAPAAEEPAAEAADDAIVIEANDQLQFSVNEFTVQAGEEVTIRLVNVGTLPKETFGHNLVILQQGGDVAAFANDAMTAQDNEYIPTDAGDRIVANTAMLGPGEEDTITFTAPSEPGEYPYLCSFPGHYATMQGVMIVE